MTEIQQTETPERKAPIALRIPATIVTYIFHPVFMPLLLAAALLWVAPNYFAILTTKQRNLWLLSIGVTTIFFPLFSVALMKPLGFIISYKMPTAKERTIPLMTSMIFYFWINHVFGHMPGVETPLILRVLLLGNFWAIIAVFMANIFTKVSLHTSGAGIMVGLFAVLMIISPVNMLVPFLAAVVLAGVIGTARMILKAHSPKQIWMGYAIGVAVELGAWLYLK